MRIVSFFITALSIIALGFVFFFSFGRFKCLKGSKRPHKCGVSAGEQVEWLINTKAVIKKRKKENKPVMEENEPLEATSVIAAMMLMLMEMTPEWKTAESKEIVTAFEPLC